MLATGILICLLLSAYIFELASKKIKIPVVIILLLLGFGLSQIVTKKFAININELGLSSVLPVLGTLGLVLIVLEGSLELELSKEKLPMVRRSGLLALCPMLILSIGFAVAAQMFGYKNLHKNMVNFLPLFIISSAIAIPTVAVFDRQIKEMVTYESSLSDIFGVILFNFFLYNESINIDAYVNFSWQLVVMIVIALFATAILAWLLAHIDHHVKFMPIILAILLIYFLTKHFHLPSLIFILILGLFLGNSNQLNNSKIQKFFKMSVLTEEIHRFKDIVAEVTFLIRSTFFVLFGFLIDSKELLDVDTIGVSLLIVIAIFIVRYFILKLIKFPTKPLLVIAPRGLITILLFLSIPDEERIAIVNNSLIIQVIILTAFVMMLSSFLNKKHNKLNT